MPPTSSAAPRTVSSSGGSRTVKVLHVITGLGVGGAELQLKAFLQHTRHECDVVTLYNPGPVAEMIRGGGNRVRDLGMTRNTQLSALLTLHRLIRTGGFEFVPAPSYPPHGLPRPASGAGAGSRCAGR